MSDLITWAKPPVVPSYPLNVISYSVSKFSVSISHFWQFTYLSIHFLHNNPIFGDNEP